MSGRAVDPFRQTLFRHGLSLNRGNTTILQINVGLLCNQVCRHCHLSAGPGRTETMDSMTADAVIAYAERSRFETIDITGGSPELNPNIEMLVERLAPPYAEVDVSIQFERPEQREEGRNTVEAPNQAAPVRGKKKAVNKALAFAAFIIGAVVLVRLTPVRGLLSAEALGGLLDMAGMWAPVSYMIIYAVGVCLFVPGTLLTGLGAAIFGPYWGFLYVWVGAMLGASAAFVIGRSLGREFAASLIGDRLKKYDDAIERNGFAAVLYLRLVYFPFTPMNFGMGLTKVRFRDYFFGTGLGIVVGTFIFTFFVGTVKEVWVSGNWGELISFKVFFSIGLFLFSFFIPRIIQKIRKPASFEKTG